MIWHIWWLAAASLVALVGGAIFHTFNYDRDHYIPADDVAAAEAAHTRDLALAEREFANKPAAGDRTAPHQPALQEA
jgi:hypothetical protein